MPWAATGHGGPVDNLRLGPKVLGYMFSVCPKGIDRHKMGPMIGVTAMVLMRTD